ncbi:MAG: cytidine deaminase, partial [Nocardia sp.]|nr:cytidine deaminase [Nocardia sp.]
SHGEILLPCGRCRQVLHEHGGPDLLVDHRGGPVRLEVLLPDAFGPDDLAAGRISD